MIEKVISICFSWLVGYSIAKSWCLLRESTTSQTLSYTSEGAIPNVVQISYKDPPAKYQSAQARRTVWKIGPFELAFEKLCPWKKGLSFIESLLKLSNDIRNALRKYKGPSISYMSLTERRCRLRKAPCCRFWWTTWCLCKKRHASNAINCLICCFFHKTGMLRKIVINCKRLQSIVMTCAKKLDFNASSIFFRTDEGDRNVCLPVRNRNFDISIFQKCTDYA